jgi:chemotaxis response regulator CheB
LVKQRTAELEKSNAELKKEVVEHKKDEEALKKSENLFRAFFEAPGALRGIVELIDNDLKYIAVNSTMAEFFGLKAEDIQSRRVSELGIPPEIIGLWIGYNKQAMGSRRAEIVALAASTGGPPALQRILLGLSPQLLSPILICQHMPPVFTRLFAERLAALSGRAVKEAEDGDLLAARTVYVAPGGKQTRLERQGKDLVVRTGPRRPEDRFAPSANHLFRSLAAVAGKNCLVAVLTGMGDDGTEGARAVNAAGGIVVAESESSAVIFGMPREVIKAGAAHHVADLDGIADLVNRHALLDAPSP